MMKKLYITFAVLTIQSFVCFSQTFEQFLAKFETAKLPISIDLKTVASMKKPLLKLIPFDEAQKYIFQVTSTFDTSFMKGNFTAQFRIEPDSLQSVRNEYKKHRLAYYFYKKLETTNEFRSVIVYKLDKTSEPPVTEYTFYLITFSKEGKMIDAIQLAQESIFMTYQFNIATISKDSAILITSLNFSDDKTLIMSKSEYVYKHHFQLTNTGKIIDVQLKFYPFTGKFVNSASGRILETEQNDTSFFVMLSEPNSNYGVGQNITRVDLKKSEFEMIMSDGFKYLCRFAEYQSSLFVKRESDGTVLEYIKK